MNETEGGRERSLRALASGVSLCAWVVGVAWRGMYIGIPRLCPPGSRQGYNETVFIRSTPTALEPLLLEHVDVLVCGRELLE